MIVQGNIKRLLPNAVPTIFPQFEGGSQTFYDHSYTPYAVPPRRPPSRSSSILKHQMPIRHETDEEPPQKIRILQNIVLGKFIDE